MEDEAELFRKIESRRICDAVRKEKMLEELIEKILQHVEYGTTVWNVTGDVPNKEFMYLQRENDTPIVCLCAYDGPAPRKDRYTDAFRCGDLSSISLGQYSDNFVKLRDGRPIPKLDERPPADEIPSTENVELFFYQSITLKVKEGGKESRKLDLILEGPENFETWIVALHRLTKRNPKWEKSAEDITQYNKCDKLLPDEKEFCAESHIHPKRFYAAKQLLDDDKIFVNLFDFRTLTLSDLMHSQLMFEFFTQKNQIEKHAVWIIAKHDLLHGFGS